MRIEIVMVIVIIGFTVLFSIQYTLNLILQEIRMIRRGLEIQQQQKEIGIRHKER